jgi:hypothetical protein
MFTWDGERAQFASFNVSSAHPRMNEMWRGLYILINQANTHIVNFQENTSADIEQMVAALRAHFGALKLGWKDAVNPLPGGGEPPPSCRYGA